MRPELFTELRRLRNEIAHGVIRLDSAALPQRLSRLGIDIPPLGLGDFMTTLTRAFAGSGGQYYVPQALLDVMSALLGGHSAAVVCDPWAGFGACLATVIQATGAHLTFAFTPNEQEAALGRVLVAAAEWRTGDSLKLLNSLDSELDVVASVLPFGARDSHTAFVTAPSGENIRLPNDLGQSILVTSAMRLGPEGVGVFVVPSSFFFSSHSIRQQFEALGLGIDAALALPSGACAPYTNISPYLTRIRRRPTPRMFVAQLSADSNTNREIIANLTHAREGGALDLGWFVASQTFAGIDAIRLAERFETVRRSFGGPAVRLGDFATAITLGRSGDDFRFPKLENSVFIPLIGSSDVVDSEDDLKLKRQNYCEVGIDPARSDARFVAQFLNSEFGKEIRETSKSGAYIPKLNKQTLTELRVFIPPIQRQKMMLDAEARIMAEQNTLLGLQSELAGLRRELWSNPGATKDVSERVAVLAKRLSGGIREHANERLDHWFETLPFPLASILRAWQATPSQDFKTKHEHLLHFFEATAEFISAIQLSAFGSNESLFAPHRDKLKEVLGSQHLSFRKATFGMWKLVVEYLGKQTRLMLSSGGKKPEDAKNDRALCGELFADPSLILPASLAQSELAGVLSRTNKMRNDWTGHGGVVSQEESQIRNEKLLAEVQNLREEFLISDLGFLLA